jgi:hypothetical protein
MVKFGTQDNPAAGTMGGVARSSYSNAHERLRISVLAIAIATTFSIRAREII